MITKMINVNKKSKKHISVYGIIVGAMLGIYSFAIIFILFWGFMVSMKSQVEFFTNAYPWFKKPIEFKYIQALTSFRVQFNVDGFGNAYMNLGGMFVNSLLYAAGCALVSTLSPLVMAYVSSKYKYRISNFIPKVVVTAMVVPIVGSAAATLEIVRALKVYDTYIGVLMLKAGFTSVYFLVFYSAFQTLSWEYAEAAFVDGASHVRVMFGIMLPLVKPIIFSVFLVFFVQYWNDYSTLLMFYPSRPTAALGLFYFNRDTRTNANETMLLTGCILITIPVIILFSIFGEKLMGNISMGGIKG